MLRGRLTTATSMPNLLCADGQSWFGRCRRPVKGAMPVIAPRGYVGMNNDIHRKMTERWKPRKNCFGGRAARKKEKIGPISRAFRRLPSRWYRVDGSQRRASSVRSILVCVFRIWVETFRLCPRGLSRGNQNKRRRECSDLRQTLIHATVAASIRCQAAQNRMIVVNAAAACPKEL